MKNSLALKLFLKCFRYSLK